MIEFHYQTVEGNRNAAYLNVKEKPIRKKITFGHSIKNAS